MLVFSHKLPFPHNYILINLSQRDPFSVKQYFTKMNQILNTQLNYQK